MLDLRPETTSSPVIVGSLLIGADEMVAEMVRQHTPVSHVREFGFGPCVAFGIVRSGRLIGGVVFNNYRGHDIHVSVAFNGRGRVLPGDVRALCDYPFGQLGCKRVTAITGKKNKRARKILERIGFTLEGVARRGLDGFEDAMIFGLLRENCKWLKSNDDISSRSPRAA